MSNFSKLMDNKANLLQVRLKVDPAACKNGEITQFKEYVGVMLAEKRFDKSCETILKKYGLYQEGIFDTIGANIKRAGQAVAAKVKSDITSPFKDPQFNPFVGQVKAVDTSESGEIITMLEAEWLDVNKKINFLDENNKRLGSFSFNELQQKDKSLDSYFKTLMAKQNKIKATKQASPSVPPVTPTPPVATTNP